MKKNASSTVLFLLNNSIFTPFVHIVGLRNLIICFIVIVYPFLLPIDHYLTESTVTFLVLMLLLVAAIIRLLRNQVVYVNKIDIMFGLFAIGYALRVWWKNPVLDHPVLIHFFTVVGIYLYVRDSRLNRSFFCLLFCAGLIQCIWFVLQICNILPSRHSGFPGTGSFFNPALLGLFLVMAFWSGVVAGVGKQRKIIELLRMMALLVLLVCIVYVNSRASWIAFFAGGTWFFLRFFKFARIDQLFPKHKKDRIAAAVVGVLLLFSALYGLYSLRPDSVQGRFLIWQVVAAKIPEAFSLGWGALESQYMPMQAEWFMAHSDSVFVKLAGDNAYAFNEFLRVAFETGMVGLLWVVVLLFKAFSAALRGNKMAYRAGGLLLIVVVFGLFGYPFSDLWMTLVVTMILALVSANTRSGLRFELKVSFYIRSLGLLAILSLTILACHEYVWKKRADRLLQMAQHHPAVLYDSLMLRCYEHLNLYPDFVLCYGKTLHNNELYQTALPVLEQAYTLRPTSALVCDLGICYEQTGDFDRSERAYTEAAYMVPSHILPRYRLFCLYRKQDDTVNATAAARYMLKMPVKVVNSSVLRYRNQARIFLRENLQSSK